MKKWINGNMVEMTPEEEKEYNNDKNILSLNKNKLTENQRILKLEEEINNIKRYYRDGVNNA